MIILASQSPRRQELMKLTGLPFTVRVADIDETMDPALPVQQEVTRVSRRKAQAIAAGASPDDIVIAADTIVYADEIMGKPNDAADGFRMLCKLRGGMHYVATGVALVEAGRQNARVFTEVTRVYFKNYTDEELRAYLATEEPYDKAGGYAIQGTFAKYIDHIEGDYDNVVGFPWKRIQKELSLLAAFSTCADVQESVAEPESAMSDMRPDKTNI